MIVLITAPTVGVLILELLHEKPRLLLPIRKFDNVRDIDFVGITRIALLNFLTHIVTPQRRYLSTPEPTCARIIDLGPGLFNQILAALLLRSLPSVLVDCSQC